MARKLPPGLSHSQRVMLSEFFAGHLTAGELSERVGAPNARTEATSGGLADTAEQPAVTHRSRRGLRVWRFALVPVVCAAGAAVGVVIGTHPQVATSAQAAHFHVAHSVRAKHRHAHVSPQPAVTSAVGAPTGTTTPTTSRPAHRSTHHTAQRSTNDTPVNTTVTQTVTTTPTTPTTSPPATTGTTTPSGSTGTTT